jgi:hypothetical protein
MEIEKLFCEIDDFCEIFEKRWQQELLPSSERKRNKKFNLCLSEVMTIIIYFHQSSYRNFKDYYTKRQSWFILSQVIPAQRAAQLIQGHRGTIENQLHWVLDVVQQEDSSLIQAAQPAALMSLLRSWAISAFRQALVMPRLPKRSACSGMTCPLLFPSFRESTLPLPW